MKKQIVFLLIFIACFADSYSQRIFGIVYEERTKEPVPGVNVYLDGTSVNTITDVNGKFELRAEHVINTRLIISHVIYETVVVDEPFKHPSYRVYLKEKNLELNEVVVKGKSLFPRKKMLEVFRSNFLGNTKEGRSCTISNEEDINLRYDATTFTLYASSEKPLIVINQYLGYEIRFQLSDFNVKYNTKTLNSIDMASALFFGTTSFVDLQPNDLKINKRRRDTYKKSGPYFMKNLAEGTIKQSGHKLYKEGYVVNSNDIFAIRDTISGKIVKLIDSSKKRDLLGKPVLESISFMQNGNKSELIFLTDSFFVDLYGNTNSVNDIVYSGYISAQRLGNMLPLNYELEDSF